MRVAINLQFGTRHSTRTGCARHRCDFPALSVENVSNLANGLNSRCISMLQLTLAGSTNGNFGFVDSSEGAEPCKTHLPSNGTYSN